MRIVIDMQSAQLDRVSDGAPGEILALVLGMVQQSGEDEFYLALCSAYPESIEPIRFAFDSMLPQSRIRVWHPLSSAATVDAGHPQAARWRAQTNELLRDAFFASLEPNIVFIPVDVDINLRDRLIYSEPASQRFVTVVALTNKPKFPGKKQIPFNGSDAAKAGDRFKNADLLLALPSVSIDTASRYFDVEPERISACWATDPSAAEPSSVEGRARHLLPLLKECLLTKKRLVWEPQTAKQTAVPRLKLAYVSPLPPERSGISDYSAELIPNLAEYYEIDVVISQAEITTPWIVESPFTLVANAPDPHCLTSSRS